MVYNLAKGKRLITLSGDTHNGWFSDLTTNGGTIAGKELAASAVTSPGFESYLGTDPANLAGFEQALPVLIDDLMYLDASRRGYVLATFSATQVVSEWRYVSTIATPTTATVVSHTETIKS